MAVPPPRDIPPVGMQTLVPLAHMQDGGRIDNEVNRSHEITSRIEEIMSARVQHRTRMFARVLGPFFAIVAVVVALRAPDMRQLLSEFTASDVWPWVTGAFILMGASRSLPSINCGVARPPSSSRSSDG